MELPTLKNGEVVNDLGKYMTELLETLKKHLGYHNPTSIDKMKLQLWYGGIGSISNVFGECKIALYWTKIY
jgi:hypothetical protein